MREMKDSGIEWIGEIPAEWICDKVCRQFALIGSGTTPKSDNDSNYIGNIHWIQSGDINGGILHNTKNKVSNEVVEKYSALKVYKSPFIVIAMYGASIGNISSSIIDGCVNQACCVLSEGHMNIKYAFYTLKSAKDYLIYNGVGGGQPNISQDIVKQLRLPVPSIREQEMIADYLDKKCAEIDAVIEKTKATIEEYKKLKQSVITEVVTKGIRGDRPMKDSGIEWIGEIPAEWQVSPLQYYVELNKSTLGEDTPADYEFDYVEIGAVTLENGISEYQRYKFSDAPSRARRVVQPNDIIISTVRTYLKAIAIVPEKENVVVSTGFAVLTPRNINIDYLGFALKSEYFVHTVTANSVGISYPAINSSDLVKFKIAIPTKEEQEEIAEYLGKKCIEMDTLIAKKTALLAEMESYKKSVIYEYVTGKKEV